MRNRINIAAVGVAGLTSFFISFLWYTLLFRAPYLDGLGKTAEQLAKGPSTLEASLLQLAGNLIMAYILAWLMARLGATSAIHGVKVAALTWVGFIAATIVPMYAFQAFSFTFTAINIGYALVVLVTMGAILGGWKRSR